MTTFHLPDLGEGLQDAEIVSWHVQEGDAVKADQPMVSVETAKAVVEVPSPYSGTIVKLHGKPGDVIGTGQPLVDFKLEGSAGAAQAAAAQISHAESGGGHASITVVGRMAVSDQELVEHAVAGSGSSAAQRTRVRAAPTVRMLAKRLNVDLTQIKATGRHGLITLDDVLNSGAVQRAGQSARPRMPPLGERLAGEFEPLQGARRAMSHAMSVSRDEVAMVTLFDDADIHAWPNQSGMTPRIIRAIVAGVRAEPALNAVFDPSSPSGGPSRRMFKHVDVGIAVDIGDKLLVPVIREAGDKSLDELRDELNRLKQAARDRTLSPAELRDYTISLTNFGTLAGRYATPLVVPPAVAILGAGKVHRDVVAADNGIEVHSRIPLSLSFDHRCITGGEACRFLAAVIEDLERSS